jgi:hypothetical protein
MKTATMGSLITSILTLALMAGVSGAQEPPKQIRVGGTEPPLEVKVSTSKKAYDINEPIVFRVTPNQPAYVYLFNIPAGSPTAIQLFPNVHEGVQPLVAKKEVTIPSKGTFRSDRPGVEKVLLVASIQPLTLSSARTVGEFEEVAHDEVDTLVKQIRVDVPEAPQRLVKQLEVTIKGKEARTVSAPPAPPSGAPKPAALIATDKITYGATDGVTITYGADTAGHLAIYLLNPTKQVTLLKETTVERSKMYKLRAEAAPPAGEHVLLAVFNARTRPASSTEAFVTQMLTPEQLGKDLRLIEEPDAYAVYRFTTR